MREQLKRSVTRSKNTQPSHTISNEANTSYKSVPGRSGSNNFLRDQTIIISESTTNKHSRVENTVTSVDGSKVKEAEACNINRSDIFNEPQEAPPERPQTLPLHSALPKRNPLPPLLVSEKPAFSRRGSTTSTLSNLPAAKSKGVQMVSEMRARVRNLEMKIHSRVPRLRISSFSRSASPRYLKSPTIQSSTPNPQTRQSVDRLSIESRSRTSMESMSRNGAESPGWVLILEETPVRRLRKDETGRRRGGTVQSMPVGMGTEAVDSPEASYSTKNPLQRSGNLKQKFKALTPAPVGERPLTPTSLPIPTRTVGTGDTRAPRAAFASSKRVINSSKKQSNFTKSSVEDERNAESIQAARRRQSLGTPTTNSTDNQYMRSTIKGGRSSLPNAFPNSHLTALSQSAHKQSTESGQFGSDNIAPISVASSFSRSRIGRPAQSKRTTLRSSSPRNLEVPSDLDGV